MPCVLCDDACCVDLVHVGAVVVLRGDYCPESVWLELVVP